VKPSGNSLEKGSKIEQAVRVGHQKMNVKLSFFIGVAGFQTFSNIRPVGTVEQIISLKSRFLDEFRRFVHKIINKLQPFERADEGVKFGLELNVC